MRRVEVVALLEHLELEVREHVAQTLRDLFVLIRVAESAEGEVDRTVEAPEGIAVDLARLECAADRADACWTIRHPWGRVAGRWWGKGGTRLDGKPHEGGHEL